MQQNSSPDIIENTIRRHNGLLKILLLDRTRTTKRKSHNIMWLTDSYAGHQPKAEITIPDITGDNTYLIQPRIMKSRTEQKTRTRDKAEVFTPREIVSQMNQQADWSFGNWPATDENWQKYVDELKLEITCGEAPFIVGRYNAVNGKKVLKLKDRVGFLDRKLQVVSSFCNDQQSWLDWAKRAFKASYGYEWQGDNLLLARENLLYTCIDDFSDKFPDGTICLDQTVSQRHMQILHEIAIIISWNIFQMDGIRYTIPMSCKHKIITEDLPPIFAMMGEKPKTTKSICQGCLTGNPWQHNGKYVKIMDWEKQQTIKFVDILKGNK